MIKLLLCDPAADLLSVGDGPEAAIRQLEPAYQNSSGNAENPRGPAPSSPCCSGRKFGIYGGTDISSLRLPLIAALLIGGVSSALAQDKGTLDPKPLSQLAHPEDPKTPAKELFGRRPKPTDMSSRSIGFYSARLPRRRARIADRWRGLEGHAVVAQSQLVGNGVKIDLTYAKIDQKDCAVLGLRLAKRLRTILQGDQNTQP